MIACALLFTALSFAASSRGNWKAWELVTAAVAAAVFCSVKPPYAPILLAGLVPGLLRRDKAASVIRAHAILIAVALGAASVWLLFAKSSMTSPLDGSHPSLQMSFVLHHPTLFNAALVHTLRNPGSRRSVLFNRRHLRMAECAAPARLCLFLASGQFCDHLERRRPRLCAAVRPPRDLVPRLRPGQCLADHARVVPYRERMWG